MKDRVLVELNLVEILSLIDYHDKAIKNVENLKGNKLSSKWQQNQIPIWLAEHKERIEILIELKDKFCYSAIHRTKRQKRKRYL